MMFSENGPIIRPAKISSIRYCSTTFGCRVAQVGGRVEHWELKDTGGRAYMGTILYSNGQDHPITQVTDMDPNSSTGTRTQHLH